jgi:glucose/arabinose dehydrogenase
VLVAASSWLVACSDSGPIDPPFDIPLHASVAVFGTEVAGGLIELSAADVGVRSFDVEVVAGFATATFDAPPGENRTVSMRLFDASQVDTHSGAAVVDVMAQPDSVFAFPLIPLTGGDTLMATLSDLVVMVEAPPFSVATGDTATVSATVVRALLDTLDVPVSWESADASVATVTSTGGQTARVLGVTTGEVLIHASYRGVTAGAVVTVTEAVPGTMSLELVADGFQSPIYLTHVPGDSARLFVVERSGGVMIVRGGSVLPTPFLDIGGRVLSGGERGLLGLAFHPRYADNGQFFVYYTNSAGNSTLSRFGVSANPDSANPSSESVLLTVDQPYTNHNGGMLAFGPDGMLYVGLGDGGSGGDPLGHGQDSTTLLGTILRIDVDGGTPYGIPADNPFVNDTAAADEIWAYGVRNPWRFSFDRLVGDLYIADVGQNQWEEIDLQLASSGGGENYGWNVMEGAHCYNAQTCNETGLVLPVVEYSHGEGCSVTGGYVYRGTALSGMTGRYFYGEYCVGWIRSFRLDGGEATDPMDHSSDLGTVLQLASFGEDARGELYVVSLGGSVYRIVP